MESTPRPVSSPSRSDHPLALWDLPKVKEITTFGTSKIYALVAEEKFPAPLKLSRKCVRWRAGDIMAYLEALA